MRTSAIRNAPLGSSEVEMPKSHSSRVVDTKRLKAIDMHIKVTRIEVEADRETDRCSLVIQFRECEIILLKISFSYKETRNCYQLTWEFKFCVGDPLSFPLKSLTLQGFIIYCRSLC